jgi:hypothetical protein
LVSRVKKDNEKAENKAYAVLRFPGVQPRLSTLCLLLCTLLAVQCICLQRREAKRAKMAIRLRQKKIMQQKSQLFHI